MLSEALDIKMFMAAMTSRKRVYTQDKNMVGSMIKNDSSLDIDKM